tara:strand:+ start:354 stop:1229 length:876 start_codon:yes stop_codon:yes gene_type:complete
MASQILNRQLVMASPLGNIANAGESVTLTMTISEPGQVILSNLVLSANLSTAASAPEAGVLGQLALTSLELNGAIQYIRGRGSLAAPAGAFSAYRGTNQISLPTVHVQAGDTIAATLTSEATNADNIDCQMACAFIPDNKRISALEPDAPSVYLASVVDEVASDNDISVSVTVDESGILHLGSLQVRAYCDLAAAGAGAGDWFDGLSGVSFSSFTLPTGNNIFLGQGTVGVPGTMFGAGQRYYSWFAGGAIRVSGGDQLTLSGKNYGADTVNTSFGMRFYPDKMTDYSGCK